MKTSVKKSKKKEPNYLRKGRTRAGNRKCRRCKVVFYRNKGEDFTICPRCRQHCVRCDIELTDKTIDKGAARKSCYYCKKCVTERVRLGRLASGWKQRDYDLFRHYGITVNEYEDMLKAQNGVCWICNSLPKRNRLSVDHKHEPGENCRNPREKRERVRGLLCWHCNAALAKFKDNPQLLRDAADYLEICPGQDVLRKTKEKTI